MVCTVFAYCYKNVLCMMTINTLYCPFSYPRYIVFNYAFPFAVGVDQADQTSLVKLLKVRYI
nr:hypothetical protein [uncultured organism]